MFFSNLVLPVLALSSAALASPVEIAERQTQKLRISTFAVRLSITHLTSYPLTFPSKPNATQPLPIPLFNLLLSSSPQLTLFHSSSAPRRLHHRNHLLACSSLGPTCRCESCEPSAICRLAKLQPAELQAINSQLGSTPRRPLGLASRRHCQQLPRGVAQENSR